MPDHRGSTQASHSPTLGWWVTAQATGHKRSVLLVTCTRSPQLFKETGRVGGLEGYGPVIRQAGARITSTSARPAPHEDLCCAAGHSRLGAYPHAFPHHPREAGGGWGRYESNPCWRNLDAPHTAPHCVSGSATSQGCHEATAQGRIGNAPGQHGLCTRQWGLLSEHGAFDCMATPQDRPGTPPPAHKGEGGQSQGAAAIERNTLQGSHSQPVLQWLQVLLTLFPESFAHFVHTTCTLSVQCGYLDL